MKSVFNSVYPDQSKGKDVYLQGSRQMDSLSRQYYERNLGAGMFVSPETENGLVGYSEPLRVSSSTRASRRRSTRSRTRCRHGSRAKTTSSTSRRATPTSRSTRATPACL